MSKEWLMNYGAQTLVQTALAMVTGYLMTQFKNLKKETETKQEEDRIQLAATQAGVKALLKNGIVEAAHKAKQKGFVYLFELENIESMFKEYSNLRGNGPVGQLVNEVRQLPIKTDLK